MSDYISLEALRAMSGESLKMRWQEAEFPFDLASCGNCVTQHKYSPGLCGIHGSFSEQASYLRVAFQPRPDELRANLPEIYALRLYHKDLYQNNPLEILDSPTGINEQELIEVSREE